MAIFINQNKKVKNIFANVNGEKKSVSSVWVNNNAIPTKVFQLNATKNDPYEIAPYNAYKNWNYTLDYTNNIITLNYYIGSETDVIVYANYLISNKVYKTQIASNDVHNDLTRKYMFNGNKETNCKRILTIRFSDYIDTSNVTNMFAMFAYCASLTSIDLSNFDTRNVTDMGWMFASCESLTSINLNNFNTSNVTDMKDMFAGCESLTSIDLSNFDTRNVTDMNNMFNSCHHLEIIYVTRNKWIINDSCNTENMFIMCGTSYLTYK